MLTYPHINAVALQIGPIKIYWYGLMYLFSFILAGFLAKVQAKKLQYDWDTEIVCDFVFYCAVGAVLGGRIGYVLFYGFDAFLDDPFFIFKTWLGGMSFHGGLLGVIVALLFFARKIKKPFLELIDFAAVLTPLGLALGRIGNFINSELWGRITTVPWGMVFPNGGAFLRHPSQLYEAFTEGLLLFIIVWLYASKPRKHGSVSALFLFGYGIMRFCCEFFRQPDLQLGFIVGNFLTMGQLLSLPMIIIGCVSFIFLNRKNIR